MRAVTRTTLSLGDLLEIPIGLVAAMGSQDVKFDTACMDGMARRQFFAHPRDVRPALEDGFVREILAPQDGRALLDPSDRETEITGYVPLDDDDVIRGVRVGDRFYEVPPSELDAARSATKLSAVEVLEFIDYRRVPTDRLSGSLWIQPDPGFARPLSVLMHAMRRTGRAMVVKYAVKDRQRLGVIRVRRTPGGDALLLNDVAFANNWRDADDRVLEPATVEPDERAVAHAVEIIEGLAGDGDHLDLTRDELPARYAGIIERAHEGIYDDPARVLELAASLREEDNHARADELVRWAGKRWPAVEDKREEAEAIIASGENVGERLAALVG